MIRAQERKNKKGELEEQILPDAKVPINILLRHHEVNFAVNVRILCRHKTLHFVPGPNFNGKAQMEI